MSSANGPDRGSQPSTGRIRGLDGLRGLAALGVFLFHRAVNVPYLGSMCVYIFFVLSGYLIVGLLMRSREQIEAGISTVGAELKRFWIRRSLRVFPPYYALLAAVPIWWLVLGEPSAEPGIAWYLPYTQNIYMGYISHTWGRLSHLWSLAVEEQFYLVSAPLFTLVPVRLHKRIGAAFVGTAILVFSAMTLARMPDNTLYVTPLVSFGLMGCGALLADEQRRGTLRCFGPFTLVSSVALLAVAADASALPLPARFHASYACYLLSLVGCTALMAYIITNPRSAAVAVLELPPLRWLGTISYGLYLYHFVIPLLDRNGALMSLLPHASVSGTRWLRVAINLIETLAVATVSFYALERPLISLKHRFEAPQKVKPRPVTRVDSQLAVVAD